MLARVRSRKGQISIMIAMMTVTFGFFFVFVVSTGALVSAKINLQNAADMAAYAGAAVQARQLNNISFLNYEMRRQYKKFLFRYYILGTKAYKPPGPPNWSPSGTGAGFKVPSVCVTFNQKSNHCMVEQLKKIKPPPVNPLDSVSSALATQLNELEKIRQDQCSMSWYTNKMLLFLWLFNTDPSLEKVKQKLAEPALTKDVADTRAVLETIQGLANDLGLIPRLALLSRRIESLSQFVNKSAVLDASFDAVQLMRTNQSPDNNPALNERTIQAFFSAYYTLGSGEQNDSFPGDGIRLTEVLPAQLLALEPIKADFATYFTYFETSPGSGVGGRTYEQGTCVPFPVGFFSRQIPVGVRKLPSALTYYAVKLEAEANLLFKARMFPGNPFRMRLKAYSAAQPFGSRIGPPLTEADFVKPAKAFYPGILGQPLVGTGDPIGVPNLCLVNNGAACVKDYWDLGAYQKLQDSVPVTADGRIDLGDPNTYFNAMAPNPSERGKYNIINDFTLDAGRRNAFVQYFPTDKGDAPAGEPVYSIYAPIFPPGASPSQTKGIINEMVERSFSEAGGVTTANGEARSDGLKRALTIGLDEYVSKLSRGAGENGEGNYIARIRNPFKGKARPGANDWDNITGVETLSMGPDIRSSGSYPNKLNNSWAAKNESAMRETGRLGYSVKFVSFESIRSGGGNMTINGQDGWGNGAPAADSDTQDDIENLSH